MNSTEVAIDEAIHPTAIIGPEASIPPDVRIGPFVVIEGPVQVGPGCVIEAHACLSGPLVLGPDNLVGHGAILGKGPQSKSYRNEPTKLVIGHGNTFREYSTVHRGTVDGGGITRVGDRNLLMIGAHIGHDCQVGNDCTLVNGALLAGHVHLADGCILSGHSAVQQRVRIGRLAMIGGLGSTTKDIPPFMLQQGYNCVTGLNLVGMRRAGLGSAAINALRGAYRILFKEGRNQVDALARIEADLGHCPEVMELVLFVRTSKIGINPARESNQRLRAF